MGVKVGFFKNCENEVVQVSFAGAGVADMEGVRFGASPVIIRMFGEPGKFTPIRYQLGTVTLIAEGKEHLDLMTTNVLDVGVTITNRTTGEVLFTGWVSPNTYSQSLSSRVNELSVEVVDCLGAAKHLEYPFDGLRVRTLREIVTRIMAAYFPALDELCVPLTLRVMPGEQYEHNLDEGTPRYMEMSVSERAFVEDVDPYVPEISEGVSQPMRWPATTLTCYEVLEQLANSLLYSLTQCGNSWEFVDDIQTVTEGVRYYWSYCTDDGWQSLSYDGRDEQREYEGYYVEGGDRADATVAYSCVDKFRKFTIKNNYEEEVRMYPSLFSEGLLQGVGDMSYIPGEGGKQYQQVESVCYDVLPPAWEGGRYRGAIMMAEATLEEREEEERPATLFSSVLSWDKTLLMYSPTALPASRPVVLAKKDAFPVEVAPRSGVGIYIKLTAGLVFGTFTSRPSQYLSDLEWRSPQSPGVAYIRIKVGDYWYDALPVYPDMGGRQEYWGAGDAIDNLAKIPIVGSLSDRGRWYRNDAEMYYTVRIYAAAVRDLHEWNNNIPVGGELRVEVLNAPGKIGDVTAVITDFEVGTCPSYENVRTYTALELSSPITVYDKAVEDGEYEHELPLNVCFAHCRGYLSPRIDGVDYAREVKVKISEAGREYESVGFRTMLAYFTDVSRDEAYYGSSAVRLRRLVNGGKSYSTEVALRERGRKGIAPRSCVVMDGERYRVVSFERDLFNKTVNVLLL